VKTELQPNLQTTPIAIIGLASVFPNAKNLQDYWDNIIKEVDCIIDVPPSRWSIEDYYDPDPTTPDKTYCKRGGFLPNIDFDPLEFGLPPNILEVTDVSQLLSLIVARDVLQDAGYLESTAEIRDQTGVILGVGGGQKLLPTLSNRLQYPIWETALKSSGLSDKETQKIIKKIKSAYVQWEENAFPGMLGNVIAGRIANRFDLGGINCVVDAACASSLGALKMAIGELVEGRANMMITGGVDTDNSILMYMSFSKTPAFSRSDKPRPFDINSDGMMIGEGIGMLVLKRLADAERDGDSIYAVVKGIGSSSDGRYKSIYAPRSAGQAKALQRAYDDAGFDPETVGLVEAHGTGTVVGDMTEFGTLKQFFGDEHSVRQHIALGSVKSQIGHTKAAAGAASLVKVALALHHKLLPPTLNVTQPNPKYGIEESSFYINSEPRPWFRTEHELPRRAGVSSFGFGGTNYHTVLEEYIATEAADEPIRLHRTGQTVILAEQTPTLLLARCQAIQQQWQGDKANQIYRDVVALSQTLDIPTNHARIGFVAESFAEAQTLLELAINYLQTLIKQDNSTESTVQHPKGIYYRAQGLDTRGRVVTLFSGQGSQYLNMGRDLAMNFPVVRHLFEEMDTLFADNQQSALSQVIFPRPVFDKTSRKEQEQQLQQTEHAQPAIGLVSMGLYKLLQQAGFVADFAGGHSFGELSALWAGGVLNDETYLQLIKARGQAMAAPTRADFDAGTMLALAGKIDLKTLQQHLNQTKVQIANYNAPNQVVLAGPNKAIEAVRPTLKKHGYRTIPLPVSAAFHTSLVGHAHKPFAQMVNKARIKRPQIPIYSNSSARPYPTSFKAMKKLLADQLLNPVRFQEEIENLYQAGGRVFVEVGPRNILTKLVGDILGDKSHVAISVNPNRNQSADLQLRKALVQLRVIGLPLHTLDDETKQLPEPVIKKKGLKVALGGHNYVSPKTQEIYQQSLTEPVLEQKTEAIAQGLAVGAEYQTNIVAVPEIHGLANAQNETLLPTHNRENGRYQGLNGYHGNMMSTNGHTGTPEAHRHRITPIVMNGDTSPTSPSGLGQSSSEPQNTIIQTSQDETVKGTASSISKPQSKISTALPSTTSNQPTVPSISTKTTQSTNLTTSTPLAASLLESLAETQRENLRTHQQYLNNQAEYARTFQQLTLQQQTLMSNLSMEAQNSLERSMMRFHDHQTDTLQVHAQYLQQQNEQSQAFINLIQTATTDKAVITDRSVALPQFNNPPPFIAEQTPPTNLIPQTAISITNDQQLDGKNGEQTIEHPSTVHSVYPSTPDGQSAQPTSVIHDLPLVDLQTTLLNIVSDKTGYPVDMIELEMDMEADLGIDSIKRVEIMGTMQDQFPDLPQLDQEHLSDLRTLQEILDYLEQKAGSRETEVRSSRQKTEYPSSVPKVHPSTPTEQSPHSTQASSKMVVADLQVALLDIVSDKTGYPADMVELDMDMEADLGIDSIKRVEIMGTMQDRFPELPSLEQDTLADLRTLQEILDYLERISDEKVQGESISSQGVTHGLSENETEQSKLSNSVPRSTLSTGKVHRLEVDLKPIPQPDFMALDLPSNPICLLTDDGTEVSLQVAQQLAKHGWAVLLLSFPETVIKASNSRFVPDNVLIDRIILADMSESHLQSQLKAIKQQHGIIHTFVHINPCINDASTEKQILKQIFLLAKHLKPSLTRQITQGRTAFLTTTRLDGAFGLLQNNGYGAVSGGLFGLTKTLNLEWPRVFCRTVDLSQTLTPEEVATYIVAELYDPNQLLVEVGYTSNGRVTITGR